MSVLIQPDEQIQAAKIAIEQAMRPHVDALGAEKMLAVLAQMTGMLIGLQDQTKYTSEAVFDMVLENIVLGNQTLIEQTLGKPEGTT
jgi:hypothetical protein